MPNAVVDASVALKWVLPEPDSAAAERLQEWSLQAPALLMIECGNAVWIRVLKGLLSASEAQSCLAELARAPITLVPERGILRLALALAIDLAHPVYDCLYLALAIDRGMPVVTADRRFHAAARTHAETRNAVLWLADIVH